jgi:hypothetical protein
MEKTINNTFELTLREMRAGQVVSDLSDELGKVIEAVRATGKPGELQLRIKVRPASKGDIATVLVEDKIDSKLPRPERAQTIFFTTDGNGLQRQDPRQTEMELRVVVGNSSLSNLRSATAS